MIRLLGIFLLIFISTPDTISQEVEEVDFVLVIDGEIANNVENFKMKWVSDDTSKYIDVGYHPGRLSIKKSFFDKIVSKKTDSIQFIFSYGKKNKQKYKKYFYNIDLNKKWFEEPFIVLKIYNLDNRKYRKKYKPVSSELDYSLSVDFGHFSILNLK